MATVLLDMLEKPTPHPAYLWVAVCTLNTILFLVSYSIFTSQPPGCQQMPSWHIQLPVKWKYSCGSLVKYSQSHFCWLFFRHCIITSVKGGWICHSSILYYDGKASEYHSLWHNIQSRVIDLTGTTPYRIKSWFYYIMISISTGICIPIITISLTLMMLTSRVHILFMQ